MDEKALAGVRDELHTVHEKVDLVVSHVIAISERTLALADLPAQLATAMQRVSGTLAEVRRSVLAVAKAKVPSTFILVPEISMKEAMSMERRDSKARQRLVQWSEIISEVLSSPQPMALLTRRLSGQRYRLRLLCERCCCPQGEGYVVEKQGEWVPRLLPALALSYKVVQVRGRETTPKYLFS